MGDRELLLRCEGFCRDIHAGRRTPGDVAAVLATWQIQRAITRPQERLALEVLDVFVPMLNDVVSGAKAESAAAREARKGVQ